MAELVTFVDADFAGQRRRFELKDSRLARILGGPGYEAHTGSLSGLVAAIKGDGLAGSQVRAILVEGLAQGAATNHAAAATVDAAMKGRPLAEFIPLAIDIVEAAYAGRTVENGA